ncbi:flavin reductase family protein [Geoglobus acetivorans]|uniref:Rubredoxin n=1 Tax=Geoglobus acetivorans TaxID=565033 RepID=A0A0A7GCF3_GEOAI|nr:Rubredoxin [Geoglobus acetivorans]
MNPEALYRISYGLYIVSSHKDGVPNGQIANTVFQVTSEPVMVAVCLNNKNLTNECVKESGVFSVSVLDRNTPLKFIGKFGFRTGRDSNKFEDVDFFWGKTGAPVVRDHSIAYIEAEVRDIMEVRTHTLFFGEVVEAEILKDGEPLTYAEYHYKMKGKTPETATVYLEHLRM